MAVNFDDNFETSNITAVGNDTSDDNFTSLLVTFPEDGLRHSMETILIYSMAYSLVFVFGFIGNILVILVIVRTPSLKNATNYFIFSLAVADVLVNVFCLPATLLSNIFIRKYSLWQSIQRV